MVRKYKRKLSLSVGSESFNLALKAVQHTGLTVYKAAKLFQVPESTLRRHVSAEGPIQRVGRPCSLTDRAEEQLCKVIVYTAQLGWPMGKEELYDVVAEYVRAQGLQSLSLIHISEPTRR